MSTHNSDDSMERFSMGRLEGAELAEFEKHLLQCNECQEGVRRMDLFLGVIRRAAGTVRQHDRPTTGTPRARFAGEYHLLQASLHKTRRQNIGILLLAGADRLETMFRRDFGEFAGERADWLQKLTQEITEKATDIGAKKCLEWLATFPLLRISPAKPVDVEGAAATALLELYNEHIRPKALPFRTHLPQYTLEAAAGVFGRQMTSEPEGWVEVRTDLPLSEDMFVVHVEGHSMEPKIPDGSLCAFRHKIDGSWDGKTLLIQQYGESGGNRYTVKICQLSDTHEPVRRGDDPDWAHQRVTLKSLNPDYESWDVASNEKIRALGEFLFVVGPSAT
jgi:hypothetical protein